ncbi:hypothetical protein [Saccharopolyspora taberi]|uniref:Uncharacterized protein n=1 Tax=Saccharopolyspora taberi TaxID=60895 RepID=A0ABN3V7I0_9PSEU
MNAATKLGGFALIAAIAFGGAYAVGSAVGPLDGESTQQQETANHDHGSETGR